MLYNLLTTHGRAQAYAYSSQGAFLVRQLELAEDNAIEELTGEVEEKLDEMGETIKVKREDFTGLQKLKEFADSLGRRDGAAFRQILEEIESEQIDLRDRLARCYSWISEIKKLLGID